MNHSVVAFYTHKNNLIVRILKKKLFCLPEVAKERDPQLTNPSTQTK